MIQIEQKFVDSFRDADIGLLWFLSSQGDLFCSDSGTHLELFKKVSQWKGSEKCIPPKDKSDIVAAGRVVYLLSGPKYNWGSDSLGVSTPEEIKAIIERALGEEFPKQGLCFWDRSPI